MDDRETVAAIRAALAERVGKERYEFWFGPGTQLLLRGEKLIVQVRDQFYQDWLRLHFRKDLENIAQEVSGVALSLEFHIAPVARVERAAATNAANVAASTPAPAIKAPPRSAQAVSTQAATLSCERATTREPAQRFVAPHDELRRRPYANLDSFVLGSSNCVAYKTAQVTAQQPGTYNPLLIHGGTGTGKTHLLEAICSEFRRLRPRARTLYLSAEQFTSEFLQALHGSGLPNFRRKYRGLELLVIDDVHFFANKKTTLGELLYTAETLLRAGRQLVFAADRPPAQLKMLGHELTARLSGGMVCRLDPAEYSTRLGIVRQFAARMALTVPADVEAYIASHFTTQSRELAGALKRLQATSMALQKPLTLALAEEALTELIDHHSRAVNLADIERAVCDEFGLSPASLQSAGKGRCVSQPRMLAMFLARKHTRAPLSEIGAYFGRRSHSTVILAQKKVAQWMAGTGVAQGQRAAPAVNLEEMIRRVEQRLRTA
ncbi:MAG: chromosomal replication initiator protein DnaA [Pirellulales bacterium]